MRAKGAFLYHARRRLPIEPGPAPPEKQGFELLYTRTTLVRQP